MVRDMEFLLTVLFFSAAKATIREDEGISSVDPGFCERVEGNGNCRGVSSPTWALPPCGFSWIVPAAGEKYSSRKQVLPTPRTSCDVMACLSLGVFPGALMCVWECGCALGREYVCLDASPTWRQSSACCFKRPPLGQRVCLYTLPPAPARLLIFLCPLCG